MTTLTCIFLLPLLAAIVLAFVPRNFAVIMRAVAGGFPNLLSRRAASLRR